MSQRTLYADVDKTLIHPFKSPGQATDYTGEIIDINGVEFAVLLDNVYMVERFAANAGMEIIFWSDGGALWAEQVAIALGMQKIPTAFLTKPTWFLDDRADAGFAQDPEKWIDASAAWPDVLAEE